MTESAGKLSSKGSSWGEMLVRLLLGQLVMSMREVVGGGVSFVFRLAELWASV